MRFTRHLSIVACALAGVVISGCGGGGSKSTPTAPSSPTPTSITVNASSSILKLGTSETFTATMAMSDGSTRAITGGVWGGDAPTVATVEASTGRVSAVGSGMVTIWVDYQGARGTKLTRVVPDYHGLWTGSYFVEGCTASGAWADERVCDEFLVNEVLPGDLVFWQEDDSIDGYVYIGAMEGEGGGTIETGGGLVVSAIGRTDEGFSVDSTWWLRSDQVERITGTLSWTMRLDGYPGEMRVDGRLRSMVRELADIGAERVRRAPVRRGPAPTRRGLRAAVDVVRTR